MKDIGKNVQQYDTMLEGISVQSDISTGVNEKVLNSWV
jgi:hypothetical protein